MTAGFGAPTAPSIETTALKSIDSRQKTFVNKDFTKNIAWLNNSVDTLSAFTQKLQQGVDSANQNVIEQISGFAADLFVFFGGGEPTGMDIGDLKYVLQGIGALFGLNPATPFPMNLVDAAGNLLTNFLIPLPQFTDVIFDAIEAWAVQLGLSPTFVQALKDLDAAINSLGDALGSSVGEIFDALSNLLSAFMPAGSGLGTLWDSITGLFSGVGDLAFLTPVFSMLADLGVPFINALTEIVRFGTNLLNPLSFISGAQITVLGENTAPPTSGDTTIWSVGGDTTNAWAWDATQSALKTDGTSQNKRVMTQGYYTAIPGQVLCCNANISWSGIPSGADGFGLAIIFYYDAEEQTSVYGNIAAGHGSSTTGFSALPTATITVPQNVNGFRIGAYVNNSITTGSVWVHDISVQLQGTISHTLIGDLVEFVTSLPQNVMNLFGQIPSFLLGLIGIGSVGNTAPNLLTAPDFGSADTISIGANWFWDGTVGRTKPGSIKVVANGVGRELDSNIIPASAGQTIAINVWCMWAGLTYTGNTPISMYISRYTGGDRGWEGTLVGCDEINSFTNPVANQGVWQNLVGTYTIPDDCDSVRLVFKIPSTVSIGTIWFDDASFTKTGLLQQTWINGLIDSFGVLGDWIQEIVNAILSAIRGIPFVGNFAADLFDQIIGWREGTNATALTAVSATTIQSQQSIAKPGYLALDASADATFPITTISGSSPSLIPVTPAAGIIGFINVSDNGKKCSALWLGQDTTGLTGIYLNLYSINPITGLMNRIQTSPNILASVSNTSSWNYYNFNIPIDTIVGNWYGVEMVVTGTGTYHIAGIANNWIPVNYAVYPQQHGAKRTTELPAAPSTFTPTYSGDLPFFGLGGFLFAGPTSAEFNTAGTYVYTIPNWMKYGDNIDCAICSAGGGGAAGSFGWGQGGSAGIWKVVTLVYGIDFPAEATELTFIVGAGGPCTGYGGANGGDTKITCPGMNDIIVTGGAGGLMNVIDLSGKSPGNVVLNEIPYYGGGPQNNGSSPGFAPGGGGAGASVFGAWGGTGADGVIWAKAYQAGKLPA